MAIINDVLAPFVCNLKKKKPFGAIAWQDFIYVELSGDPPQFVNYYGQIYGNPTLIFNPKEYEVSVQGTLAGQTRQPPIPIGTHNNPVSGDLNLSKSNINRLSGDLNLSKSNINRLSGDLNLSKSNIYRYTKTTPENQRNIVLMGGVYYTK